MEITIVKRDREKEVEERFEELKEGLLKEGLHEKDSFEGNFNRKDLELRKIAMEAVAALRANRLDGWDGEESEMFAKYSRRLSAKLAEGEFVCLRESGGDGLIYNKWERWTILGHRLPLGDPPPEWTSLIGTRSRGYEKGSSQYGEYWEYSLVRADGGEVAAEYRYAPDSSDRYFEPPNAWGLTENNGLGDFESVAEELGLTRMPHPYGYLYLDGNRPVAVHEKPQYKRESYAVLGDLNFFHTKGFAVLEHNKRETYYGAGDYYSCSVEIIKREQNIENLQQNDWYPVEMKDHFVVWGTGLYLYPKRLEWNVALDPATAGARIFDSSKARFERVLKFFEEKVGFPVHAKDIKKLYEMMADGSDTDRAGTWANSYQYPADWIPPFDGWALSRLGEVECRWKQPRKGAARFYGVIR